MNVYDYAHQLARSLKESSEYQQYKALEEKVKSDPQSKNMLDGFRKHQLEVQKMQMLGQQVEEYKIQELQSLYNKLVENPLISELLGAEYRLTQMMGDIYKILGEALNLDMSGFEQ
ncbi:YlbF family regulator [Natronincola ferrireducens]|uniref:UPF0342 protein SAMN05660472_01509 n=1 Tax=Natronincola ferrireducens TaxID=393762 RepID=A0A1G9CND6_9FIRM|nr:YlbF family regulator [Natronincola ferrireducens]SDK52974.1 Cell fate regulator YlbF, YheA/YmcA/DUF963 family (controls sporulation, competence, biofilm development) [Natronincola ferrireducens]